MTHNIGNTDRMLRLIIGLILLAIGIFGSVGKTLTLILVVAGIVMLVTSAVRFCPLYRIFGIQTCRTR